MKRFINTLALTAVAIGMTVDNALAQPVMVPVGNPGNAADPTTGLGAVANNYRIGQFEVTLNQYTAFLNAVAATDTYGLWNANMNTANLNSKGIVRSGASGSYSYAVFGTGDRPVTYVSWFDAARYVNWIQNGMPSGLQVAGTTEDGAYTLLGANSGVGFTRNPGAVWFLPSQNEWYKAAYHQPASAGGDVDDYWLYPTKSNVLPTSRNGSLTDPNSANFYFDDGIANGFNGGYATTQSASSSSSVNYLTSAGAYALAGSYYGTYDQGGNVTEWNDDVSGTQRGARGGSWNNLDTNMRATLSGAIGPTFEGNFLGFRIAAIPEPSAVCLMTLGAALLVCRRKRTT
jgi:formylglycine-generating enzyme